MKCALDYSCSKLFGEAVSPTPSPNRADGFLITIPGGEESANPPPPDPPRGGEVVVVKNRG